MEKVFFLILNPGEGGRFTPFPPISTGPEQVIIATFSRLGFGNKSDISDTSLVRLLCIYRVYSISHWSKRPLESPWLVGKFSNHVEYTDFFLHLLNFWVYLILFFSQIKNLTLNGKPWKNFLRILLTFL